MITRPVAAGVSREATPVSAATPDDEAARRLQGHLDAECWCDLIPVEPHRVGDPHPAGTFDLTAPTPGTPVTTWPTDEEVAAVLDFDDFPSGVALEVMVHQVAAREAAAREEGRAGALRSAGEAFRMLDEDGYLRWLAARAAAVAVPDTTHEGDPS